MESIILIDKVPQMYQYFLPVKILIRQYFRFPL